MRPDCLSERRRDAIVGAFRAPRRSPGWARREEGAGGRALCALCRAPAARVGRRSGGTSPRAFPPASISPRCRAFRPKWSSVYPQAGPRPSTRRRASRASRRRRLSALYVATHAPGRRMTIELAAVTGRDVSRETVEKLQAYQPLVDDGERAPEPRFARPRWMTSGSRHVLDSAQLLRFAPDRCELGRYRLGRRACPGIVVACLGDGPVTLIEPRRLRAEFLERVVETLGLDAHVHHGKGRIGARAASTSSPPAPSRRWPSSSTYPTICPQETRLFLFPKGKSARIRTGRGAADVASCVSRGTKR